MVQINLGMPFLSALAPLSEKHKALLSAQFNCKFYSLSIPSFVHCPLPRSRSFEYTFIHYLLSFIHSFKMQYFLTSAALVASASLSLAAPANLVPRSAFEIKQIAGPKVFKNGPMQMMKTFNKYSRYGAKAPSEVQAAAAAAQSGEVSADPQQYDQAYLSPVTVGTSKVNLDFDTGSADL